MAGAAWLRRCGPAPTSMQKGEVPSLDRCRKLPNHRRESHKHRQGPGVGRARIEVCSLEKKERTSGRRGRSPTLVASRGPMRSVILLSWILDPTRLRFSFWRAHGETQKGVRAAARSRCGTPGKRTTSSRREFLRQRDVIGIRAVVDKLHLRHFARQSRFVTVDPSAPTASALDQCPATTAPEQDKAVFRHESPQCGPQSWDDAAENPDTVLPGSFMLRS